MAGNEMNSEDSVNFKLLMSGQFPLDDDNFRGPQQYDEAFREEAVRQIVEEGYSTGEVSEKLGVRQGIIENWLQKHKKEEYWKLQQEKLHKYNQRRKKIGFTSFLIGIVAVILHFTIPAEYAPVLYAGILVATIVAIVKVR